MLYITSLNSGSNGNCFYLGNDTDAVLVDAGLSCKETERRMEGAGLSMQRVRAVFISHEHTDHIKGLMSLVNKYRLPVYASRATFEACLKTGMTSPAIHFAAGLPVAIGSMTITAFRKHHDACEPHSFIVENEGVCAGVFTDIGRCCGELKKYFSLCHAAFLEANYDDEMLENGRYPYFLKKRIRGGQGHLSNKEALDIFTKYRSRHLSHLLLSHLSADNNCPELVMRTFVPHAGRTKLVIAGRYAATPVYYITSSATAVREKKIPVQMQLWV